MLNEKQSPVRYLPTTSSLCDGRTRHKISQTASQQPEATLNNKNINNNIAQLQITRNGSCVEVGVSFTSFSLFCRPYKLTPQKKALLLHFCRKTGGKCPENWIIASYSAANGRS